MIQHLSVKVVTPFVHPTRLGSFVESLRTVLTALHF